MTPVLDVLDRTPPFGTAWFDEIEASLARQSSDWLAEVRATRRVSDERAWVLLSWVELAATAVVRRAAVTLLEAAIFARSLLVASELDQRDIAIVESLLRRGADLAGLAFAQAVDAGCARAAEFGVAARSALLHAAPETPSTHVETGAGRTFAFQRKPVGFDPAELERWLSNET